MPKCPYCSQELPDPNLYTLATYHAWRERNKYNGQIVPILNDGPAFHAFVNKHYVILEVGLPLEGWAQIWEEFVADQDFKDEGAIPTDAQT